MQTGYQARKRMAEIKIGREKIECPQELKNLAASGLELKGKLEFLQERLKAVNTGIGEMIAPMLADHGTGQLSIITDAGELTVKQVDTVGIKKGGVAKIMERLAALGKEIELYLRVKYEPLAPLKKSEDPVILECLELKSSGMTFSYKP